MVLVLVIAALVGCGASRATRTSTEILTLSSTRGLGLAYIQVRGAMPVVRIVGHLIPHLNRIGTYAPARDVHGPRQCSVVDVAGTRVPSLSAYAGERFTISVYGTSLLTHAFCAGLHDRAPDKG